jgi:hypothetical protein
MLSGRVIEEPPDLIAVNDLQQAAGLPSFLVGRWATVRPVPQQPAGVYRCRCFHGNPASKIVGLD